MRTSPSVTTVVDLFVGAGGRDEGLGELGHHAVGIETDGLACKTAKAAGPRRVPIDLARPVPMPDFALRSACRSVCGSAPGSGRGSLRPVPQTPRIPCHCTGSGRCLVGDIFLYAVTVGWGQ
jgi:site-specific DNA-cytosine methylase